VFSIPHGRRVDKNGYVWVTDNGFHQVMEFTNDGKLVRTLGTKGKPDATHDTFNRPTDVGFLANGDILVTDGYGNSRVVKFSRDGKYLMEWGKKGKGPGEFDSPLLPQVRNIRGRCRGGRSALARNQGERKQESGE
jgi:DNA-binding beta-propeller fold protein YncE